MDRRKFLATSASIGAAVLPLNGANAANAKESKEFVGVLVDTTRCIGCRTCEVACSETWGNFVPDSKSDNALEQRRDTSEKQFTVVNRFSTDKGEVFVKRQCMHCWQAACVSMCLVNAMYKTKEGPVTWNGDKCLGCRFCMVACPFDIPKAEYHSWNPRIMKCHMCYERLQQGKKPACVEACKEKALFFGDLKDPESQVRKALQNRIIYQRQPELGTKPKVYYIL